MKLLFCLLGFAIPITSASRITCIVDNALQFENAFRNSSCQAMKLTDFEVAGARLDMIFSDLAAGGFTGRRMGSLVLSGTKFGDGAVLSLGNAIKDGFIVPENLIFWNNGLDSTETESSEAIYALIEIIQSASNVLHELHFTDNLLLDDGAAGLGLALSSAPFLGNLVLSGNGIGPAGVLEMCSNLIGATSLHSLSITGIEGGANSWMSNKVEVDGAKGLTKFMKSQNCNLRTLVLSGANLGDAGARELAKGIAGNSVIKMIDLHRNSIGDDGATALAKAFAEAPSLELVVLTANKISDSGALALSEAISRNPVLKVVDVDMNVRVSNIGKQAIEGALHRVPTTTQFRHHEEL